MTSTRSPLFSLTLSAVLLAGCAGNPMAVTPGMPRAEVIAKVGQPTRAVALPDGERLQYSSQPRGQRAVMVDLDSAGKVVSARQVLNLADFSRIEPGKWTREDVEREFGPPAMIDRVWGWNGDIMTYRWADTSDMFYWVYLDGGNVVRRTQQGMEFVNAPDHD